MSRWRFLLYETCVLYAINLISLTYSIDKAFTSAAFSWRTGEPPLQLIARTAGAYQLKTAGTGLLIVLGFHGATAILPVAEEESFVMSPCQ